MRKIVSVLLPIITIACLFGSSKMIKPEAQIATVNGRPILAAEMDSTMELIRKGSSYGVDPESLKSAALDSLVDRELINTRIDSIAAALDNEWEFSTLRRENIGEVVKKILFEKQISSRVSIDSARIDQYYENSKSEFREPESVKARHILIRRAIPDTSGGKSEKKKQKIIDKSDRDAKKAADDIMEMALSGRDWDSLASAYSEDKSNASKGGDLGNIFRGRMLPEFDSAAFSAEPGKIVGPVSTKLGYHIIKVEEHKLEREKPLDSEIRDEIRSKLSREDERKFATVYMDSLKAAGQYTYNDSLLSSDENFPQDTWVMSINATDTLYFKRYKESLPRYMKWKKLEKVAVEDKKDMLSYLATDFLLLSASRTIGYFGNPEVTTASHDYTFREAKQRAENLLKDTTYEPSEIEIDDYFYAHIKDYTFERPLLVYHIIFQDSSFAETIRDSILAGVDFVEMAKRYYPGEPEIREVAYNLDYIGPEDMGHEFFEAANALSVGQISHAVKTKWGFHIIKLISKKEDRKVSQVRPGIINKLKSGRDQERRAEVLREWKRVADITLDGKLYARLALQEKKILNDESSEKKSSQTGG